MGVTGYKLLFGGFWGRLKEAWFSYGLVALRRQGKFYVYDLNNLNAYEIGILNDKFGASRKYWKINADLFL